MVSRRSILKMGLAGVGQSLLTPLDSMAATLGTTHSSRRHPQDIKGLKDALQTAIQLEFSTIPLYLCAAWSIMDTANPDRHTILGIGNCQCSCRLDG